MATSLPGMSSYSEGSPELERQTFGRSPRSHVLDKHLESELASKKKKRKIICRVFLRVVLQIDGEMSGEEARRKITTSERDAIRGDGESERWISMSETPHITLLLLSVQ